MGSITVREAMTASPYVLHPDAQMYDATEFMLSHEITAAIVAVDGSLEGLITNTDLLEFLDDGRDHASVREYMEEDVIVISPDATISDGIDKMVEYSFHHLPVVTDDSRVVGIVSSANLMNPVMIFGEHQ